MQLSNDFFSVCQTAIKQAAWKYEDFGRVKAVEGELERLRVFMQSQPDTTPIEKTIVIGQGDNLRANTIEVSSNPNPNILEPPTALKPDKAEIVTPDQAKEAPARPMPDDILALVQGGLEVAKNPPRVAPVQVEDLPKDPDAARNAFNKPF